jgi:4-hydroxy-tetrahydrodipicolinate reductase
MKKLKVAVVGAGGRMGASILLLLASDNSIDIVGALEQKSHGIIGKKLNSIISGAKPNVKVEHDLNKALSKAEGIIDFSSPVSSLNTALYASKNNKTLVIGTTGFSQKQKNTIKRLSANFPCLLSPNMSIGVNIMFEISQNLTQLLHKDFDIEILESHHRNKNDSPSGTALRVAELVAGSMGKKLKDIAVYSRHGNIGARKKGELGIQTLRGGDVIGEHSLLFYGDGERLELIHKASSRVTFARGAIMALKWLIDKPNGLYSMKDVLGFNAN